MPDKQERNCPCGDETCHLDREKKMVLDKERGFHCDPCIEPIVRALNDAGLKTIASCCGHGFRPGNIVLADKREIVIARDFEEARRIDRLFPVDINGDRWTDDAREHVDRLTEILQRVWAFVEAEADARGFSDEEDYDNEYQAQPLLVEIDVGFAILRKLERGGDD